MPQTAVRIIGDPSASGPLVITCEHASNRVEPPLLADLDDCRWLDSHWGWDIGAAAVSEELARLSNSVGVLADFSRLVCDPNRDPTDATWIRTEVEGSALGFNAGIDEAERIRRLRRYYDPYHHVVDSVLGERLAHSGDVLLLSVHSFTPHFGTESRSMEVGILFADYEPVARRLAAQLDQEGFVVALNEPYSGLEGLIFAANRHGREHGVIYLEIELRQDLIGTASDAIAVAGKVWRALDRLRLRRMPRETVAKATR